MNSKKKSYLNLEKQDLDRKRFKKVFQDQKVAKQTKPWVDDFFPPNENSLLGRKKTGEYLDPNEVKMIGPLMNPKGIEWKRAKDIVKDPMLFGDKISVESLRLGEIANTYYLSALSSLSQYPNLINQIFITKKVNQECVYQVSLFIDGEFQIVYIDDFVPVLKGTSTPFFTKTTSFEIWGLLLEKAWAKVNGGYLNIVTCSIADLFRALTGFSCLSLNTKEEEAFNIWKNMKNAFNNKWVMCGTVRGDEPKAKKHGLVNGSTYNILFCEDIYDNSNKKQSLIKFKNPWGANVWTGDYSEGSNAWTESIIEQIGLNRVNKNTEGEFWMSLKDVTNYFETIDICQIIFGGKTFNFMYKGNSLLVPQIFNINLKDTGILSISAYEKKWRYNRELKGSIHPTSLILGEYDPDSKEIKKIYSYFSCDNDTEIAEKVNGGYYILWVYKPADLAKGRKPDFLRVRIASDEDLSVKYSGPDPEFLDIADIVARSVRYKNKSKIKKEEFFYDIQNSLDKSGIAYRLILNDTSDLYEDWDNDASAVEGITLLPPYNKNKKFLFRVNPNSYVAVLGMQKEEYGTHWFNLKSKINQMPVDTLKEEIRNPVANPNTLYNTEVDNSMNQPDYITTSYDVAIEQTKFPIGKNVKNVHLNKLKQNYNRLMNTFKKSFPSEMKNNKLVPTEIKKGELSFFGESNPKTKEGRGVFYDEKNDMILVTTWKDQDESSFGQIYNYLGNLVYEGEMVNGIANGKGTFFFPGGEKYYGNFENGIMEGNGIFYWDDGSRWEGTFSNNKLHGEGMFYNPRTKASFKATYRNNKLLDENSSNIGGGGFSSLRKKGSRERDRERERERDRERDRERENVFKKEKEIDGGREIEREVYRDGKTEIIKETEIYRNEPEREPRRKMLFRGRGKIGGNRGRGEMGGRYMNINSLNMDRDIERKVEFDKHSDRDNNEVEKQVVIEKEVKEFENPGPKGLGNRILRFKRKEIIRDKPHKSDSEDDNNEEEEGVSDKDEEDSQNENNREPGNYRMYQRNKNRFIRGRRDGSDGEDSYE